MRLAWERQRTTSVADSHMVVASLPCSIFVNAHPANLLTDALRGWKGSAGGDMPLAVRGLRLAAIAFEVEPEYVPDVERPLVFHVFGNVDSPDSLVLTEDDYLGHLVAVTEAKALIPLAVRRSLADSSLLLLGLGLEDWDARSSC